MSGLQVFIPSVISSIKVLPEPDCIPSIARSARCLVFKSPFPSPIRDHQQRRFPRCTHLLLDLQGRERELFIFRQLGPGVGIWRLPQAQHVAPSTGRLSCRPTAFLSMVQCIMYIGLPWPSNHFKNLFYRCALVLLLRAVPFSFSSRTKVP